MPVVVRAPAVKALVRPSAPVIRQPARPPTPVTRQLVRPPTPTAAPRTTQPLGLNQGAPNRGAGQQLSIAKPPAPRQTPTGGARPTQGAASPATRTTAPNPIVNAALRQQTGGTGGATAPRPPAAKPAATAPRPYIPQPDTNPVGRSTVGGETETTTGKAPPAPAPGTTNVGPGGKTPGPPQGAPDQGTPNTTLPPAPAVPNPPVTPGGNPNPIPLVPADEAAKYAAGQDWNTAQAVARQNMQNAALAYGDPQLMAQWGLPATVNPNSALALAATKAQLDTQRA